MTYQEAVKIKDNYTYLVGQKYNTIIQNIETEILSIIVTPFGIMESREFIKEVTNNPAKQIDYNLDEYDVFLILKPASFPTTLLSNISLTEFKAKFMST